jgi:hypothetical protein
MLSFGLDQENQSVTRLLTEPVLPRRPRSNYSQNPLHAFKAFEWRGWRAVRVPRLNGANDGGDYFVSSAALGIAVAMRRAGFHETDSTA